MTNQILTKPHIRVTYLNGKRVYECRFRIGPATFGVGATPAESYWNMSSNVYERLVLRELARRKPTRSQLPKAY